MVNSEKPIDDTVPVFMPPKKRQTSKKAAGGHNYVDHIVCVQVKVKMKTNQNSFSSKIIIIMASKLKFQPSDRQYPLSSSLEDLLSRTNQMGEKKQLTALMKAASKTSIDQLLKKSATQDVSSYLEDGIKTQSMCRKSPAMRSNLKGTASTSRSEDNLDMNNITKGTNNNNVRNNKKRVNILTSIDNNNPMSKQNFGSSSISIENDRGDLAEDFNETNLLNSKTSSLARSNRSTDNYLTMAGTIKRGKKKGQSIDVQLNISRDELEKISAAATIMQQDYVNSQKSCCVCSPKSGMHILLLSLISLPFVVLITSIYGFYIGTITWYNVFNYFNEEKTFLHKLVMSPLLIISYPIIILFCTIGLAIYSGLVQISMKFTKWSNEIADIEKGFYGHLCHFLNLDDCSPYEVVILTDLKIPEETVPANSSTGELSI